ncbi:MAG: hypothetical protein DYG98_19265 [Haliscomenobacteraceae bacterium CHB4]|nr:hypothetical protein [Saprospiraceae bacterium]MCE7925200.1 hypothetical protein [Haliscomenobacteraceae bacterium CHB4]
MAIILLFDHPDLLSEEWLATAAGIAITFVVFIMGVPALIFQTFIAGGLRDVYNERLGSEWSRLFKIQLGLIVLIFLLGNVGFDKSILPQNWWWLFPFCVTGLLFAVLFLGLRSLIKNFQSSRNIELQLSQKITDDAIRHFERHKSVPKKDLEDLGILARELRGGRIKNIFLEQCERLVEYLLNVPQDDRDTKLIGDILADAVCLSVTYDGAQFNNENMRKALDILIFTYSHIQHHSTGDTSSSYLNTTIGNCMREIGIQAMLKDDQPAVMNAVEKLSAMEATSKEMFVLGNDALLHGHVQPAVAVIRKLGGKVRDAIAPGKEPEYEDKRTFYFWLGLVAKLHRRGGAAQNFAQRRLQNVVAQFDDARDEIRTLFKETQKNFYQVADFDTADAVRELEGILFPE